MTSWSWDWQYSQDLVGTSSKSEIQKVPNSRWFPRLKNKLMVKYKILPIVLQNMTNLTGRDTKDPLTAVTRWPDLGQAAPARRTSCTRPRRTWWYKPRRDRWMSSTSGGYLRIERNPLQPLLPACAARGPPATLWWSAWPASACKKQTSYKDPRVAHQLVRAWGTLCSRSRCSAMPHRVPAWTSPVSASSSRRKKLARYQGPRSLKQQADRTTYQITGHGG